MPDRPRAGAGLSPLVWPALAAASFVVGLAALVRMLTPAPGGSDDIRAVIRLPEPVTISIVSLFGLAAAVVSAHLIRRGWRRQRAEAEELERLQEARTLPPWVKAVMRIFPLLYLLALIYALWQGWIHIPDIMALGRGSGSAMSSSVPEPPPANAPPLFTWAFGLLGLAVGLTALALALWVAFSDRLEQWWTDAESDTPAAPFAHGGDESLDGLCADADPRRAIIGCYRSFERAAAGSRVERRPWDTPLEFMREVLSRLPLPRPALGTLTGLFERARFSHHSLGPRERDLALTALIEIKAAIEETRPHVGSR
jgi:hypothetical protein